MGWPSPSALGLTELLPQMTGIAYVSVASAGNVQFTLSTVVGGQVRVIEREVSFGVYKYAITTFKIDQAVWAAAAPTREPKSRDLLTDDKGNVWRVTRNMAPSVHGAPWRLVCNRLIIDAALCDTISIKKPVDTTDVFLSPLTAQGVATYPLSNLPCRIQYDRQETDNFQGVQFQRQFYKVYVASLDDSLELGDVIVATSGQFNGTTFRMLSTDSVETLESLEVLTVTIDPVP